MPLKILFFSYHDLYGLNKSDYLSVIDNILSRGAYIMQYVLQDFERVLAHFLSSKHVICVADGTIAIILDLRAAVCVPVDEFIVASHTFVATALAVHLVSVVPVLCDCGVDHLINPLDIEHRIISRANVVIPVQLNS